MKRLDDSSSVDDAAFQKALRALPSVEEQARKESQRLLDEVASQLSADNVYEICEEIVDDVVDKFNLAVGGEDNAIDAWNKVYADLLWYASTKYPATGLNYPQQ